MLRGQFWLDNRVTQNSLIDRIFLIFNADGFQQKTKKTFDQDKSGLESRSKSISTLIFIKIDFHLNDFGTRS